MPYISHWQVTVFDHEPPGSRWELGKKPLAYFFAAVFGASCGKKNNMCLSENSVPLHPMVNDYYPY